MKPLFLVESRLGKRHVAGVKLKGLGRFADRRQGFGALWSGCHCNEQFTIFDAARKRLEKERVNRGEGTAEWRLAHWSGPIRRMIAAACAPCFRSPVAPSLEYQVRCAAAAGAAPIVIVVERVPQAMQDAIERLRLDGLGVFPVSDVNEAVSRFEAGSMILLIGDGVAPPVGLVTSFAEEPEPAVGTVPDDEQHESMSGSMAARAGLGWRWSSAFARLDRGDAG